MSKSLSEVLNLSKLQEIEHISYPVNMAYIFDMISIDAQNLAYHMNNSDVVYARYCGKLACSIYVPYGLRGEKYLDEVSRSKGSSLEETYKERLDEVTRQTDADPRFIQGMEKPQISSDFITGEEPTVQNIARMIVYFNNFISDIRLAGISNITPTQEFQLFRKLCYNCEQVGKLQLPSDIVEIIQSPEYKVFIDKPLSDSEKRYMDNFLECTNFFSNDWTM